MDPSSALALLRSLTRRIRAAEGQISGPFEGLVSGDEVDALELALAIVDGQPSAAKASPAIAGHEARTEDQEGHLSDVDRAPAIMRSRLILDQSALRLKASEDSALTLSLDFGTARSKAFAATSLDDEVGKLFDLPIGSLAADDAVYSVTSSVWIDEGGLLFAGNEAVRRSLLHTHEGNGRQRLDSLKQEISQVLPGEARAEQRRLTPAQNPTSAPLTIEDAITYYLAYLTDLSTTALEQQGGARYIARRFALPCWARDHRLWAAALLERCLKRAVLLADTLHGRWDDGLATENLKELVGSADRECDQLGFLIATEGEQGYVGRHGGVLEPLAAGSARIWKEDLRGLWRKLVLVVDVGAGTTDLSLFWVVQQGDKRVAFPVTPVACALRMAGDQLDSALLAQLEERAELGGDEGLRRRVRSVLSLEKRRLKEQLFKIGELQHRLVNDQVVRMTRDEFMASEGIRNFTGTLHGKIEEFVASVDGSWFAPGGADGLVIVITGGGCELPMVAALADRSWVIAGREVRPTLAPRVPKRIEQEYGPQFQAEYPQLAVALGGALPSRLSERAEQGVWLGGAPEPLGLSRYQVTGV